MEKVIYCLFLLVSAFGSISSGPAKPIHIALTDAQKLQIVEMHNDFRRRRYSSDMRHMTWDGELAWLAESYGRRCRFRHNKVRRHSEYDSVGENMYATRFIKDFNGTDAVQEWLNENREFHYHSRVCRKEGSCANYTQIVWAATYKVGCALTHCRFINDIAMRNGLLFICNYAPSGNILDSEGRLKQLYERGHACTNCDDGDYCRYKLCANSKRDFIGPPNIIITEFNPMKYIAIIITLSLAVVGLLSFILLRHFRVSIPFDKFMSITSKRSRPTDSSQTERPFQTSNSDSSDANNKTPLIAQEAQKEQPRPVSSDEKVEEEKQNSQKPEVVSQVVADVNTKEEAPSRRASRISLPKPSHPAPRSPPPSFPAPVLERFC